MYFITRWWGWGRGVGGWGISFIFTSGQHCQLIDCTHKYFCYSCNLFHYNLIIAGLKVL